MNPKKLKPSDDGKYMDLEVELLPTQLEFMEADERFVAIVSQRAAGKTFVAVLLALQYLTEGKNVVYFVQNLDAWRDGGEKHLNKFLHDFGYQERWKWNISTHTGKFKTEWGEATFKLGTYEGHGPDSIRGATEISLLVLDEFMLSSPRMLAAIVPILRGKDLQGNKIKPRIRAVSTPNMNSEWQLKVIEAEKNGIRLLRAGVNENYHVTQEQRELFAAGIFDEKLRRQELLGELLIGDNSTALNQITDFSAIVPPLIASEPIWCGLDMAHSGDRDKHVFSAVQGRHVLDIHEFGRAETSDVALYITKFHEQHKIAGINMDLAWSEAIYEALRFKIPCTQVAFGGKAIDNNLYANVRAEMLFKLAHRIRDDGLYIPENCLAEEVRREMCNIHWLQMANSNKLIIEPKADVRVRLGRSPDVSDSLALAVYGQPSEVVVRKSEIVEDRAYEDALAEIMADD